MPFGLVSACLIQGCTNLWNTGRSTTKGLLLGKGGFGRVYKATLRSGEVVAIKKMELPPFKAAEGEREFRVEVDILSRLDHPNLVNLIGYCADGKQRFLVYEYMHKGNLISHFYTRGSSKPVIRSIYSRSILRDWKFFAHQMPPPL